MLHRLAIKERGVVDRDAEQDVIRRAYAKQIMAVCGVSNRRIEAAIASVKREDFLGAGPRKSRVQVTEEHDGLRMRFAGWSRPLEAYATAFEDAGLAITSLREPVPNADDRRDCMQRWTRIPLFLWLKARPLELK